MGNRVLIYREADFGRGIDWANDGILLMFAFLSPLGGMAPPVDEWKKILDEMNARTRKLEEEYEGTCIQRKVRTSHALDSFTVPLHTPYG